MSRPITKPTGFANGKVILLGEHAVVHGAPALAVGVPLGVRIDAKPSAGPIRIRIETWGLEASAGDGTPVGAALLALLRELGLGGTGVLLIGESRLPPRAGLGSSAALATAIARALVAFHSGEIGDDRLFEAVQASERVFHGNPSGLDAAVAIHSGVLRFEREHGAQQLDVEPPSLVVAHSGVEGHTAETVAGFARWLAEHPVDGQRRLARIAELSQTGVSAVCAGRIDRLGDAMNECHEHLSWFGVSTDALNRICEVARKAGALGAKLTGGGGGGCAVALVDPSDRSEVADALSAAGYEQVLG
ncbi:MAG: mevalonate kinase [Deltaproteobacteria bacterium]|nr:mevalonate kinase [Deltaproteobacteria bacterium]